MQSFSGISFLWATFLLAILGTIYAFAYFLLTHKVSKDAESDYLYKTKNGMIDKSINKEDYINLFIQQHKPRKVFIYRDRFFFILISNVANYGDNILFLGVPLSIYRTKPCVRTRVFSLAVLYIFWYYFIVG